MNSIIKKELDSDILANLQANNNVKISLINRTDCRADELRKNAEVRHIEELKLHREESAEKKLQENRRQ